MDASGHYKSARTLSLLVDRIPNARVHERHPDHQYTAPDDRWRSDLADLGPDDVSQLDHRPNLSGQWRFLILTVTTTPIVDHARNPQ